jgi:hypothetical protein
MAKYIQLWKLQNLRRNWEEEISYSTCQNEGLTAYVICLLMLVCAERCVRVISSAASYWGYPEFSSRPGDLNWPRLFVVSSYPPGKCSDSILIKAMIASLHTVTYSWFTLHTSTRRHAVWVMDSVAKSLICEPINRAQVIPDVSQAQGGFITWFSRLIWNA